MARLLRHKNCRRTEILLGGDLFYSVYYSAFTPADSNTNPSSVCLQTYWLPEVM